MSNTNEKQRLIGLAKGDHGMLKALFFDYHPQLFRRIYSIVRDENLADDLSQQVFIRLWEKREGLQVETNFAAYLMKMGVNEALAHMRRQKAQIVPLIHQLTQKPASEFSDDGIRAEEQLLKINRAISSLPDRCQQIFRLSRHQHLTYQEIAETLAISKKTVEAQMGKALMILRKSLLALISLTGIDYFF